MNKKIFFIVFISISFVLINSCEKQVENKYSTNTDIEKSTLCKTRYLTNIYISKIPQSNTKKQPSGHFWQIAKADLFGFGTGAAAGIAIAKTGDAVSTGCAALIGGVACGTVASCAKAEELNEEKETGPNAIINTDNAQDNVGIFHYEILDNYYALNVQTSTYPYDIDIEVLYDEFESYLEDNDIESDDIDSIMPYNDFVDIWADIYAQDYEDVDTLIDDLYNSGDITYDTKEILLDYLDAINASTDYSDFADYSIEIEDEVKDSEYDEDQIIIMLGFMSTARIGAAYWNIFDWEE